MARASLLAGLAALAALSLLSGARADVSWASIAYSVGAPSIAAAGTGGSALPEVGATVTYTLTLNTNATITATATTFAASLSGAGAPSNLACMRVGGDGTNATLTPLTATALPTEASGAALDANSTIVCTCSLAVDATHAALGVLPTFTLTAAFDVGSDAPANPAALVVPTFAVWSGAALAESAVAVAAGSGSVLAVPGATRPVNVTASLGNVVTYTLTLTNGKKAVANNTGLTLAVTGDASTPAVTCSSTAAGALTAALAVDAAITCTFDITVTSTHQAAGAIPALTVAAEFGSYATDKSAGVKPTSIAAVPVWSGAALAEAAVAVAAGSGSVLAVPGATRPVNVTASLGNAVTYTLTLTNGDIAVNSTTTLTVGVALANGTALVPAPTCTAAGGTAFASGAALGVSLAANATVTCTFAVTVTAAHQAAGEIPALTVTAAFGGGADPALYVKVPASIAAVPVWSGAALAESATKPAVNGTSYTASGLTRTAASKLPAVGASVTYTLTLTNGKKAVANNTGLTLAVTGDASTPAVTCSSMAAGALTTSLAVDAAITCTFDITVTSTHQAAGAIPALTVAAEFGSYATDKSAGVKPTSIAAVPVWSGAALAEAGAAKPAVTGTSYTVSGLTRTAASKLPAVGASVLYTLTLTNGDIAITNTTTLAVAVTLADGAALSPLPAVTCTAAGGTAFASGSVLDGTGLAAAGTATCTFAIVVTAAHQAAGEIPALAAAATLGSFATSKAAFVAPASIAAVPVFTGGALALTSAAIASNSTQFIQVGDRKLAMENTTIIYTFTLTNGAKAVPNNTALAFTPSPADLACKRAGGAAVALATPILAEPALAAGEVLTCTASMVVSAAHKAAGKIAAFTVNAAFTGLGPAYTVPDATVPDFVVHTGLPTLAAAAAVVKTNTSLFGTVGDAELARAGGAVVYTITLVNGDAAIPASDNMSLALSGAPLDAAFPLVLPNPLAPCTAGGAAFNPAMSNLSANAVLVCTFTARVADSHLPGAALPGFNVALMRGAVADATAGASIAVPPTSLLTDPTLAVSHAMAATTNTAGTHFVDVDGDKVPSQDSKLTFTITFKNGALAIPAASFVKFDFDTTAVAPPPTGTAGALACTSGGGAFGLEAVRAADLPAQATVVCTFDFTVTATHKSAGRIAPLGVRVLVKPAGASTAYAQYAPTPPATNRFGYREILVQRAGAFLMQKAVVNPLNAADDGTLYAMVNGAPMAKLNGTVRRVIMLVNGDAAVAANSGLALVNVTGRPAVPPAVTPDACALSTQAGAAWNSSLPLPAKTALVCYHDDVVTASDIAAAVLKSFDVQASTSSPVNAAYAAMISLTPVPLFTTPSLTVTPSFSANGFEIGAWHGAAMARRWRSAVQRHSGARRSAVQRRGGARPAARSQRAALTRAAPSPRRARHAVSNVTMPKAGSTVTYSIRLLNGAVPVPRGTDVRVAVSDAAPGTLSCRVGSVTANPQDGLPAYAAMDCTVARTLTTADLAVPYLAAFNASATTRPPVTPQNPVPAPAPFANAAEQATIPLFTGLPCIGCRACLSTMTAFAAPLLNATDAPYVAALFYTECAKTYAAGDCERVRDAIAASTGNEVNAGKRAGAICRALGACNVTQFESSCSLASAAVPAGTLDVCTVQGTGAAASTRPPNTVPANFNLTAGMCKLNATNPALTVGCTNSSQECGSVRGAARAAIKCVCNASTGADACYDVWTCVDTPCTKCRSCFTAMRSLAAAHAATTNATAVAASVQERCLSLGAPAASCASLRFQVDASYNGNLGKRPAWVCGEMGPAGCDADAAPAIAGDCLVGANRTANESSVYFANLTLCSTNGLAALVPGVSAAGAAKPNGTCDADRACNATAGEVCSYVAGAAFCTCDAATGADTCSPLGECKVITCAACATCVRNAATWAAPRVNRTDAAALATEWQAFCTSAAIGTPQTAATCAKAGALITASVNGNFAKRAASLCSAVYRERARAAGRGRARAGCCAAACCEAPPADVPPARPRPAARARRAVCAADSTCTANVTSALNSSVALPSDSALDVCTVEGVVGGHPVPGVLEPGSELTLPADNNMTCSLYSPTFLVACPSNDIDYACDTATTAGSVCVCNAVAGSDSCLKYSPCVRTPCKVCADCLAEALPFTDVQRYTLTSAELGDAFAAHCASKGWLSTKCDAVVARIKAPDTPLAFGKRPGALCAALGACNATAWGGGAAQCALSPTGTTLDLCSTDGVAPVGGADTYVPGYPPSGGALPAGFCGLDSDCGSADMVCDKASAVSLCSCYGPTGTDSCRTLGQCRLKPCPSCAACLAGFNTIVTGAAVTSALTADAVAAAVAPVCAAANRSAAACDNLGLAIRASFKGSLGRRAGSICGLLGECMPAAMASCNLTVGALAASPFSRCTVEAVANGTAMVVDGLTYPVGAPTYDNATQCLTASQCGAGKFCDFSAGDRSCACAADTGRDTCVPRGVCVATPCAKCQACLSTLAPVIAAQRNATTPSYTAACAAFPGATATCTAINIAYIAPVGSSGLIGLRAGALCKALDQCTGLPATCALTATVGAVNVTGALDTCTAEGITGGSQLSVPAAGACLRDAGCAAGEQCDLSNVTTVYSCSGGLDSAVTFGRCVAKPVVDAAVPPCTRCGACVAALRPSTEAAALNASLTPAALGSAFYSACSAGNFSLEACRNVQAQVAASFRGNLARRTGALCMRLGECAASLATDAGCTITVNATAAVVADPVPAPAPAASPAPANATANATVASPSPSPAASPAPSPSPAPLAASTVTGALDACTVEGVATGMRVDGTFKYGGALPNGTCVLDSGCPAGQFCSSDVTVTVCRCLGGVDTCDVLSTCKAPPPPPVAAPVLSPCERCQSCITRAQGFVAASAGSSDATALAGSFAALCAANFTADPVACRRASTAISYSRAGALAKRAGALCAQLGACPLELSAPTSACNMTAGATAGRLNLCNAAGVGARAAATLPDNTTCATDADCFTNGTYSGQVCSMAAVSLSCTCGANGQDVCAPRGTCVSFCSTQAAYIAAANAEFASSVCDGPFANCGAGRECRASATCKQLSCDATVGLKTTKCYGFCLASDRKVLAARLGNSGRSISLALNTKAAPASFACAAAFDAPSAAKLGSDALCAVSGQQLDVALGQAATIAPGDTLTLAAAQSVLRDQLDPTARFVGTAVPLDLCEACAPPTAVIIGPKDVPEPCDPTTAGDIIFDASLSKDASGRRLASASWAQVVAGGAVADVALAAAIDRANVANDGKGALRVILPGSALAELKGSSFTLSVTVTSALGATATATHTFTKRASGAAPVVTSVSASPTIYFRKAEGVKVPVQLAAASVCAGSSVEYRWESLDGWAAVPAGYAKKDLVLPGPVAIPGNQTRLVSLSAYFTGKASGATNMTFTLVALPSDLTAVLKGPSGDVPAARTIVLDASGSSDADDPQATSPLAVSWSCKRADFPEPCFTGANNFGEQAGPRWRLPAALLAPGVEHTFTASVSRVAANGTTTGAPVAASLTLTPRAEAVPTGRIRRVCGGGACPPRHSADAPLALTMALDAGAEGAAVAWRSDQIPGLADVAGVAGADLVIPASALPASGSVTVDATVTAAGKSSATRLTVPINGRPACAAAACLSLGAVEGSFPSASVTAKATDFVDDDAALRRAAYDFGVKGAYESRSVVASGAAPTFTFTGLPIGDSWLFVCAVDAAGASACSEASVTVPAPAAADFKVSDALTSFDVGQLAGAGDVSVLASGAQALSSLSKFAGKADVVAGQSAEERAAVESAIAAKAGSLINTLAGSVGDYISDPQAMQQIVSAVATLSKATPSLTRDSKQKMLDVASHGIASATLRSAPLSPSEASRLWSVVAAGNGMRDSCKTPNAACAAPADAASTAARRLLELAPAFAQELPDWLDPVADASARALLEAQASAGAAAVAAPRAPAAATSASRRLLQDNATSPSPSPDASPSPAPEASPSPAPDAAADGAAAPPREPAFAGDARAVAGLLSAAATPAVPYLSGGDNGLFVSVAAQLGRSYDAAPLVVGPALDGTGGTADAASGENPTVRFSADLVGPCVDEDGTALADGDCAAVVVPAAAGAAAAGARRRLAMAGAPPADFTVVSGALTIDAGGAAPGAPLPCGAGCTATVAIPIWEDADPAMWYNCSRVVDGALTLDPADATSRGAAASGTAPAVPTVTCVVSRAGTYLVGKTLNPNRELGTPTDPYEAYAGAVARGEPVRVSLRFATVPSFDFSAFAADAAKVAAFTAAVRDTLAAAIGTTISNGVTAESITVANLREGSILVDVDVATTGVPDDATMTRLVGTLLDSPASLFGASFFAAWPDLTGEVTAALRPSVAAPAPAVNVPAIVGGVVGGVGGALLVGGVAFFVVRRRRAGGVEPRSRGLAAEGV
ncbi:hypothetical protein HT031_004492 [Scenedesmus sp. PABB004]|nr:hypothetical protein HT031_004492 [Scenedesmus sp. PABB004]